MAAQANKPHRKLFFSWSIQIPLSFAIETPPYTRQANNQSNRLAHHLHQPLGHYAIIAQARVSSIVAILVHVGALIIFGFLSLWQWIASITAFITCGILLCMYARCTYTVCPILFLVAAVFDVFALIDW